MPLFGFQMGSILLDFGQKGSFLEGGVILEGGVQFRGGSILEGGSNFRYILPF